MILNDFDVSQTILERFVRLGSMLGWKQDGRYSKQGRSVTCHLYVKRDTEMVRQQRMFLTTCSQRSPDQFCSRISHIVTQNKIAFEFDVRLLGRSSSQAWSPRLKAFKVYTQRTTKFVCADDMSDFLMHQPKFDEKKG